MSTHSAPQPKMIEDLAGKTVASVEAQTVWARDLHYKEWSSFTQTVLTFTDGTSYTVVEDTTEYDRSTFTTTDPFADDEDEQVGSVSTIPTDYPRGYDRDRY